MPLRVWTYLGIADLDLLDRHGASTSSIRTLLFGTDLPGFPSLIVSIMFFSGIQLMSLGIIGEYIGRIFAEVKRRPLYVVAERIGGAAEVERHRLPENDPHCAGPDRCSRKILSVGGWTLVSRLTGFIRDVVLAAVMGVGPVADAFVVASRIPNHFRAIFSEGAFNSAFVPTYARRAGDGRALRRRAPSRAAITHADADRAGRASRRSRLSRCRWS